jgi:hypothetical protein
LPLITYVLVRFLFPDPVRLLLPRLPPIPCTVQGAAATCVAVGWAELELPELGAVGRPTSTSGPRDGHMPPVPSPSLGLLPHPRQQGLLDLQGAALPNCQRHSLESCSCSDCVKYDILVCAYRILLRFFDGLDDGVLDGVDAVKPRGREPHSRTAAAHSPDGEFSLYNIFVFYLFMNILFCMYGKSSCSYREFLSLLVQLIK